MNAYNQDLMNLLECQKLNISTAAKKMGITRPTVMAWLRRPIMMTGSDRLIISKALNITLTELDEIIFKKPARKNKSAKNQDVVKVM